MDPNKTLPAEQDLQSPAAIRQGGQDERPRQKGDSMEVGVIGMGLGGFERGGLHASFGRGDRGSPQRRPNRRCRGGSQDPRLSC